MNSFGPEYIPGKKGSVVKKKRFGVFARGAGANVVLEVDLKIAREKGIEKTLQDFREAIENEILALIQRGA